MEFKIVRTKSAFNSLYNFRKQLYKKQQLDKENQDQNNDGCIKDPEKYRAR